MTFDQFGEQDMYYEETYRTRPPTWTLVPERQVNLMILRGKQDGTNKISYSEWARDVKDRTKSKGTQGQRLVGILEWSERLGDVPIIDEALSRLGVPADTMMHMARATCMFMKNYTPGHAKDVIQHGSAQRRRRMA